MEGKENEILIQVKVSQDEAEQNILELRKSLQALKEDRKEIERLFKAGVLTNDQYNKSLEELDRQTKVYNQDLRENRKTLEDYAKSQKAADGSLTQLRANLRSATAVYDNLSKEQRESADSGKVLQQQIKALSDELGAAEGATGRFQRNVGNYAGAIEPLIQQMVKLQEAQKLVSSTSPEFKEAERSIIGFQQAINQAGAKAGQSFDEVQAKVKSYGNAIRQTTSEIVKLENQQEQLGESGNDAYDKIGFRIASLENKIAKVPTTNKSVIDSMGELDEATGAFGGSIGSLQGFIANAQKGLQAMQLGLVGLKGAIAATGIGLLLIALGSLYAFLTRTQEGLDFLERKTAAVGKVFGFLADKAADVGKVIFDAFDNPKKALVELGEVLATNVINRFKAFAVIAEGVINLDFGKIGDGLVQAGTGIENASGKAKKFGRELADAARRGEQLAVSSQNIRRAESALNVERAKSRSIIEREKKLSEDSTKSIGVRAAAARRAYAIENGLLERQLALQQRRINLEKGERQTEAQRAKVNEEQAKFFELQEESLGKQTELQNSLNSINNEAKQQAADAAAKALERQKYEAEQRTALAELELLSAKKRGIDTLAFEENLIRRQAEAEQIGLKKNSNSRKLIEAQANADILALRVDHAQELENLEFARTGSLLNAKLILSKKGSDQEFLLRQQQIEENLKREKSAAVDAAQTNTKLKAGLNAKLREMDATANVASESLAKERAESLINFDKQIEENRLQTELDIGNGSIAIDREVAEKRIELEEKTQIALLEVDKKFSQLTDHEYLNRLNLIQGKAIAARKELAAQRLKDELDNEQAILDQRLAVTKTGTGAEYRLKKEQLALNLKAELEDAKLTEEQKEAIRAKFRKDSADADKEFFNQVADYVLQSLSGATATLSKFTDASVLRQTSILDQEQQAALSSAALSAEQRTIIEEKFQKRREELEKKSAEKRRKIASIENVINTASAVTKAFATAGPILGPILAAIAVAQGIAQQVIIDNQKFARGGVYRSDGQGAYIQGPGTAKSDSINSRLSNGESVINAASTRKHYALLSSLNVEGGGKPFPGLGLTAQKVNRDAMRGFSAGGVQSTIDSAVIARAVRDGMYGVRIAVAVDEFRRVESDAIYTENQADL